MMHKMQVECECDGRFSSVEGRAKLRDLVGQRAWTIDGVVTNTVTVTTTPHSDNMVLINRAELEELRAKVDALNWSSS